MALSDGRIGLGLAALGLAVVAVAAADATGARPAPVAGLIAGAAGAGVVGWVLARVEVWLPALLLVGVVAASVLPFLPDAGEPLAPPLGYANADGTLFAVGAIAAVGLFVSRRAPAPIRTLGWVAAVWLAVAAVIAQSVASLLVLVLGAAVTLVGRSEPRLAAAAAAGAMGIALGVTVGIAVLDRGEVDGGDLSVRARLWHEALVIAADHPLTGVGPGRYEDVEDATDDPDLRWAHHGPLQVAAELGAPGAAVLLAAGAWALVRAARADLLGGVAAGAVLAVGAHSCVDYVLHEPALPIALAFVVGAAVPPIRAADDAEPAVLSPGSPG